MTMASSSTMDHDDDVNVVDGWENDDDGAGGRLQTEFISLPGKVHHVLKVCAAHQVGKLLNVGLGGWGCAKGVNSVITQNSCH